MSSSRDSGAMIKQTRVRCVRHVACMTDKAKTYTIMFWKPGWKGFF